MHQSGASSSDVIAKRCCDSGWKRTRRSCSAAIAGAAGSAISLCADDERSLARDIERLIRQHFDCRPGALIRELDLLRPIYRQTAAYGHFGRSEKDFSWEQPTKAAALAADARSISPVRNSNGEHADKPAAKKSKKSGSTATPAN